MRQLRCSWRGRDGGPYRVLVKPLHERVDQRPTTLTVNGRYAKNGALPAIRLDERSDPRLSALRRNEVELVQHQPARLFVERLIVAFELLDDRACFGHRIDRAIERR